MKETITCHDIAGENYEVSPDKLIFRPSVYGLLIENGKILLSKQWDGYDFPGGGAKLDETVEETCAREFFEETGLRVKVTKTIHCFTSFFHPSHSEKYKGQYWNCPMIYFLVEKLGGEISTDNFDVEEKKYADLAEWIDLSEIQNIKFCNSGDSRTLIADAVKLMKL